ncbi:MAG: redoxin domain-containing protein [Solirubrobacteraceae bacterium]
MPSDRAVMSSALSGLDGAPVWLNSEALAAEDLRGSVVLVDFWTYSCVNWLRTLPYLRAWDERYRDRGLVVVGVHAPEFGFEHDLDNVRRATRELGVGYPVVIDNDFAIWRSFENRYWPALYLVGQNGHLRFHHFGEGAYEESERAIQRLLGVEEETVRVDADGLAEAADWDTLRSPETYVGDARGERRVDVRADRLALNEWALEGQWTVDEESAVLDAAADSHTLGSPETYVGDARGERRVDARADRLALNEWALAGQWTVDAESAVLDAAAGSIAYRFAGRDLNLVLAPAAGGGAVRFAVLLDGEPPGDDHGLDIDEAGEGVVAEPRMYQLVRQRGPVRPRTFEIRFLDPGARAYVFTFG